MIVGIRVRRWDFHQRDHVTRAQYYTADSKKWHRAEEACGARVIETHDLSKFT